jgi:hypothetical protein
LICWFEYKSARIWGLYIPLGMTSEPASIVRPRLHRICRQYPNHLVITTKHYIAGPS